ncbi:unnamed protein product [Acanthoscelides obtectus]|uniref:Nuclease HARBI1 n=1 Tax=Acanthoscelides obtectus TaxID=200917 RepID=A0A9P0NW42_ACAOB|nr:unnamed protein product [Acanthoscelides obtectus]CAK1661113.1 hypothetical protein AOBTE_LOCUS22449 [Acanthoscelides obtectus]
MCICNGRFAKAGYGPPGDLISDCISLFQAASWLTTKPLYEIRMCVEPINERNQPISKENQILIWGLKLETMCEVIVATAVLHNVCLEQNDTIDFFENGPEMEQIEEIQIYSFAFEKLHIEKSSLSYNSNEYIFMTKDTRCDEEVVTEIRLRIPGGKMSNPKIRRHDDLSHKFGGLK